MISERTMARYYFDIHEGRSFIRDSEGTDCAGVDALRVEAMNVLPTIAKDVIPTDGDRQAFTVSVRDENNVTVYTATLTFAGLWMGDVPIPEPEPLV